MSFSAETLLWVMKVMLVYGTMIYVFPSVVLKPLLKGRTLAQRFLINTVFGNFFYINIVLLLGLAGLTGRFFLTAATAVPFIIRFITIRESIYKCILYPLKNMFFGFLNYEVSAKFIAVSFLRTVMKILKKALNCVLRCVKSNPAEFVLFFICTGCMLFVFIRNIITYYGYQTSDMVVHQLWINEIDNGLFYDGVYPFGMHAVIFYIHQVFGIPTVVIMRVLPAAFNFFIFTMLLTAMRELCRFRYTAYIGYLLIFCSSFVQNERLSRYFSPLPQEFGTMFYFPCLIAAVMFFREFTAEEKIIEELKAKKMLYTGIKLESDYAQSTLWRWVLIISFGLTLAAHFYVTIIAGVLIAAVAVGYIKYVFKPAYLKKLISAALLAVLLPIIPMAAAFIGGTPLQGSLYWATSVMGIGTEESGTAQTEETEDGGLTQASSEIFSQGEISGETASSESPKTPSLLEKIKSFASGFAEGMKDYYTEVLLTSEKAYLLFLILMGTAALLIPVLAFLKEREYSRILTAALCNQLFMSVLAVSGRVGLPVLIDENRMACFQMYVTPLSAVLAVDGCFLLLSKIIRYKRLWNIASLAAVCVFAFTSCGLQYTEKLISVSSFQTNGAAAALYDIMENYPFQRWTVISCNEERTMMDGQGWHYEVIDFLKSMENYSESDEMYIPTKYVFFFIEKNSLNYPDGDIKIDESLWGSSIDNHVGAKWALKPLPAKNGISEYGGLNRIIVNSRMYYWAQEYKKRYPNEFKVFYEDDDFICYFIEQNEYYLNNFAVDYGYNS